MCANITTVFVARVVHPHSAFSSSAALHPARLPLPTLKPRPYNYLRQIERTHLSIRSSQYWTEVGSGPSPKAPADVGPDKETSYASKRIAQSKLPLNTKSQLDPLPTFSREVLLYPSHHLSTYRPTTGSYKKEALNISTTLSRTHWCCFPTTSSCGH